MDTVKFDGATPAFLAKYTQSKSKELQNNVNKQQTQQRLGSRVAGKALHVWQNLQKEEKTKAHSDSAQKLYSHWFGLASLFGQSSHLAFCTAIPQDYQSKHAVTPKTTSNTRKWQNSWSMLNPPTYPPIPNPPASHARHRIVLKRIESGWIFWFCIWPKSVMAVSKSPALANPGIQMPSESNRICYTAEIRKLQRVHHVCFSAVGVFCSASVALWKYTPNVYESASPLISMEKVIKSGPAKADSKSWPHPRCRIVNLLDLNKIVLTKQWLNIRQQLPF